MVVVFGRRLWRELEPDKTAVELSLRIEPNDLFGIVARNVQRRMDRLLGLEPEAMASAESKQEHGQPLVEIAPLADLLALVEDRPSNAVLRALHRRLLHLRITAVERCIPGIAKGATARPRAQPARGFAAHADMLTGGGDAAAVGELLDESELLIDCPAVVTNANGNGFRG